MNVNKGTVVTCEALANFQSKVEAKTAQVGIIGLGYVGLPLALLFARDGFAVSGFDLDASKVTMLQRGESYIRHISETVIAEHVHKKRLQATTDSSHLREMDAILICVPTPLDPHREPELSLVRNTVEVLTPHLRRGQLVVLENTYRAVNIALVKELKLLCLRTRIDIWEVIGAAKTKPFGFTAFYPGPGLGGHCNPIDPFYLTWKAREYEFPTRFIELAGEINAAMPEHVVVSLVDALNQRKQCLQDARVLVLGIAYKKDFDDPRESPSLKIMELLQARGARVEYHDPYFPRLPKMRKHDFGLESVEPTPEALAKYDVVVIATDHSTYDYPAIVRRVRLVIDTRNATHAVQEHREKIVRC